MTNKNVAVDSKKEYTCAMQQFYEEERSVVLEVCSQILFILLFLLKG